MEQSDTDAPPSSRSSSATNSSTHLGTRIIQNMRLNNSEQQQHPMGSPAASLIQSAARSMLDDATPDTVASGAVSSDDESESSCADGNLGFFHKNSPNSPSLTSLQHTKELPAIPDEQDRRRFIGCLAAILASAYDYDEQDPTATPAELAKGTFSYLDYAGDFDDEEEEETQLDDSSDNNVPRRSQSFESMESQSSFRRDQGRKPGRNASEKAKISADRHQRRRYDVLCKLLVSSSELLLLDKSVAKAFLPMLERVLVPQTRRAHQSSSSLSSSRPPLHGKSISPPKATEERIKNSNHDVSETENSGFEEIDKDDVLRPFLESLTPGSGFRCLSLLILQYLLTSQVGYDARIRHVLKKVGVIVLMHNMELDPIERELLPGKGKPNFKAYQEMATHAARKFESLEHSIARRLIRLSESNRDTKSNGGRGIADTGKNSDSGMTEKIVRGVKIGSAGIVAGTLFAVTGGLAAPGIAAGVAALAGSTAAVTAVVGVLSSTVVVTTIFGVGGGGLAAYKMQRRTQGLSEFEIQKETQAGNDNDKTDIEAELFSTICISGWLRDRYDYQRPWGLHPTKPRLSNRLELLERFYLIHSPDHVPKCRRILASWEGEERQLWAVLNEKYGTTPDRLFPLGEGTRINGFLTLEQEEVLDQIFVELGYNSAAPKQQKRPDERPPTPIERMKGYYRGANKNKARAPKPMDSQGPYRHFDSMSGPTNFDDSKAEGDKDSQNDEYQPPEHLSTVWDYTSTYGGELYTVRWESELLTAICDCVMDLALDVVTGATRQILKQTVFSTLLAAVIWPTAILKVADMIDGDWTLAVERADQAGRELAKILLFSRAGRRPVVLVGFSFGARVIYSCLKELARTQEEWEEFQELLLNVEGDSKLTSNEQLKLATMRQQYEGMREPASIIEDAILMGLPNHLSLSSWKRCRQVVAGRLVNCYSTKDMILSLMFQAKRSSLGSFDPSKGVGSILKPVCGTCPVAVSGVENIDVSDIVPGHQDYCLVTGKILERVRHGQPIRNTSTSISATSSSDSLPQEAKKLEF